jgi:hypothetical protein
LLQSTGPTAPPLKHLLGRRDVGQAGHEYKIRTRSLSKLALSHAMPPCKPLLGLKVRERERSPWRVVWQGEAGRGLTERREHATAAASFIRAPPRSQRFLDRCSLPAVCSLSSVSQPWKPPPPPPPKQSPTNHENRKVHVRADRLAGRSAGLGEEEGLGFRSVCVLEICLAVVCDYGWGCATLYRRGGRTI